MAQIGAQAPDPRLVASAEAVAREMVAEARRQGDLILDLARSEADRVRTGRSPQVDAIVRVVDSMEAAVLSEVHRLAHAAESAQAQGREFERRLTEIAGPHRPSPRSSGLSVPSITDSFPRIALPGRAFATRALYWAAVVVVALAIVVTLVLVLESRDLSSLEPT